MRFDAIYCLLFVIIIVGFFFLLSFYCWISTRILAQIQLFSLLAFLVLYVLSVFFFSMLSTENQNKTKIKEAEKKEELYHAKINNMDIEFSLCMYFVD